MHEVKGLLWPVLYPHSNGSAAGLYRAMAGEGRLCCGDLYC